MLEEIFCLVIIIFNIIDIVRKLFHGRIVDAEYVRTEAHRVDRDTTTYRSTFLIDGKEYTEDKARNTSWPGWRKKCRVILKDDGTVLDFRCVRTDIGLIIFMGFFMVVFLPSAIEQI